MAVRRGARHVSSPGVGVGAVTHNQQWWDSLVECTSQQVWEIARCRGLNAIEAAEVCQLVWLRLADHLGDLASDGQIGAWVCAVAEREARIAMARRAHRVDAAFLEGRGGVWPSPLGA
jgi:DNA-directed RNA polymerase specialized sigma24 family protein